jgi:hypothetical protein
MADSKRVCHFYDMKLAKHILFGNDIALQITPLIPASG